MSILETYQSIPSIIDPIAFAIGPFSIRWYSLMYLAVFGSTYFLMQYRIRKGESRYFWNEKKWDSFDFLFFLFLGALLGARLGFVVFYAPGYFWDNPIKIIWPFDALSNFVGLYGMSYHGGALGLIVSAFVFSKKKKVDFWKLIDFFVPCVALGYFFGRIGNFLNGELVGRVTEKEWGMYFSGENALRHPSQLYEAFLEGIVTFFILWSLRKRFINKKGVLSGIYVASYGFFRFLAEFFREPDGGYELFLGIFTKGQLFSLVMILGGGVIIFFSYIARKNEVK